MVNTSPSYPHFSECRKTVFDPFWGLGGFLLKIKVPRAGLIRTQASQAQTAKTISFASCILNARSIRYDRADHSGRHLHFKRSSRPRSLCFSAVELTFTPVGEACPTLIKNDQRIGYNVAVAEFLLANDPTQLKVNDPCQRSNDSHKILLICWRVVFGI
jgi:hypothetical protein